MTNTLNLNAVAELSGKQPNELQNVGCIKIGSKTYTVEHVNTGGVHISRQASCNPFVRLANAIYDFFARGCSTTTRASQLQSRFNAIMQEPEGASVVNAAVAVSTKRSDVLARLTLFSHQLETMVVNIDSKLHAIQAQYKARPGYMDGAESKDPAYQALSSKKNEIISYQNKIDFKDSLSVEELSALVDEGAACIAHYSAITTMKIFIDNTSAKRGIAQSTLDNSLSCQRKLQQNIIENERQQADNTQLLESVHESINTVHSDVLPRFKQNVEQLKKVQHQLVESHEKLQQELLQCEKKIEESRTVLAEKEQQLNDGVTLYNSILSVSDAFKKKLLNLHDTHNIEAEIKRYIDTIESLTPIVDNYCRLQLLASGQGKECSLEIAGNVCLKIKEHVVTCLGALTAGDDNKLAQYRRANIANVSSNVYKLCLWQYFIIAHTRQKEADLNIPQALCISPSLKDRAQRVNHEVAEVLKHHYSTVLPMSEDVLLVVNAAYRCLQDELAMLGGMSHTDKSNATGKILDEYFDLITKTNIANELYALYDQAQNRPEGENSNEELAASASVKPSASAKLVASVLSEFYEKIAIPDEVRSTDRTSLADRIDNLARIAVAYSPFDAIVEVRTSIMHICNKIAAENFLSTIFTGQLAERMKSNTSASMLSSILNTVAALIDKDKTALDIYYENIKAEAQQLTTNNDKKGALPTPQHFYETETQQYINEVVLYLKDEKHFDNPRFKKACLQNEVPSGYLSEQEITELESKIKEKRAELNAIPFTTRQLTSTELGYVSEGEIQTLQQNIDNAKQKLASSSGGANELGCLSSSDIAQLNGEIAEWQRTVDRQTITVYVPPRRLELNAEIAEMQGKIDKTRLMERQLAERRMETIINTGQALVTASNEKERFSPRSARYVATTSIHSDTVVVNQLVEQTQQSSVMLQRISDHEHEKTRRMEKIHQVQELLDDVLIINLSNIDKLIERGDKLAELEGRSEKLAADSQLFLEVAQKVRDEHDPVPRPVRELYDNICKLLS